MHNKLSFILIFSGTLLMIAGSKSVHGQSAYVKFSAGYGFPLAGGQLGSGGSSSFTTTLNPQTGEQIPRVVTINENVHGSYGSGPLLTGTFGYMFSPNLGVEGMFSYFRGREYEILNTALDSRLDNVIYYASDVETTYSRGFLFSPLFKVSAGEGAIRPYLMAGPVIGKVDFYHESNHYAEEEGLTLSEIRSTHYKGNIVKGARGVVGVEFNFSGALSLFSEVVITGMNYYPGESELTRYEVDGEDRLPSLTVRQRRTKYVEKTVWDTNEPIPSVDEPLKASRISIPMSSISANAGIKFSFGN